MELERARQPATSAYSVGMGPLVVMRDAGRGKKRKRAGAPVNEMKRSPGE